MRTPILSVKYNKKIKRRGRIEDTTKEMHQRSVADIMYGKAHHLIIYIADDLSPEDVRLILFMN